MFSFGKMWTFLEKWPFFWADKAGLGKYHTGGYGRIGVYRVKMVRGLMLQAGCSPCSTSGPLQGSANLVSGCPGQLEKGSGQPDLGVWLPSRQPRFSSFISENIFNP